MVTTWSEQSSQFIETFIYNSGIGETEATFLQDGALLYYLSDRPVLRTRRGFDIKPRMGCRKMYITKT